MADSKLPATTTKGRIDEIVGKARNKINTLTGQVADYAGKATRAEQATKTLTTALKREGLEKAELATLAVAQNEQVLTRTGVPHRLTVDGGGMAAAVGIDVAAYEALAWLAAKYPQVAKHQKILVGVPHLTVGLPMYGFSMYKRAKNGGFPSTLLETGEEAAKHLIVVGTSNMIKSHLAG